MIAQKKHPANCTECINDKNFRFIFEKNAPLGAGYIKKYKVKISRRKL